MKALYKATFNQTKTKSNMNYGKRLGQLTEIKV